MPRGFDVVGTDVLGDAAGFAGRHLGAPDVVEQRGLAVVDVTHDGHHRRRGLQGTSLCSADPRGKHPDRPAWRPRLVAHLLDHDHGRFLVQHLVDGDHRTHLHHGLDDFGAFTAILWARSATEMVSGNMHFTDHRLGRGLETAWPSSVRLPCFPGYRFAPAAARIGAARLDARLLSRPRRRHGRRQPSSPRSCPVLPGFLCSVSLLGPARLLRLRLAALLFGLPRQLWPRRRPPRPPASCRPVRLRGPAFPSIPVPGAPQLAAGGAPFLAGAPRRSSPSPITGSAGPSAGPRQSTTAPRPPGLFRRPGSTSTTSGLGRPRRRPRQPPATANRA